MRRPAADEHRPDRRNHRPVRRRPPLHVAGSGSFKVSGWAVDQSREAAAAGVDVVSIKTPFPTLYGTDRGDVAAYFKRPEYLRERLSRRRSRKADRQGTARRCRCASSPLDRRCYLPDVRADTDRCRLTHEKDRALLRLDRRRLPGAHEPVRPAGPGGLVRPGVVGATGRPIDDGRCRRRPRPFLVRSASVTRPPSCRSISRRGWSAGCASSFPRPWWRRRRDLPFETGSVDFVVSSECIEHTRDPRQAVREMLRVLRPGGVLFLTTPNLLWRWSVGLAELLRIRRFEGIENWLSRPALRRAIVESGGEIIGTAGLHILPFQLTPLLPVIRLVNERGQWLKPLMINQCWIAQKRSTRDRRPPTMERDVLTVLEEVARIAPSLHKAGPFPRRRSTRWSAMRPQQPVDHSAETGRRRQHALVLASERGSHGLCHGRRDQQHQGDRIVSAAASRGRAIRRRSDPADAAAPHLHGSSAAGARRRPARLPVSGSGVLLSLSPSRSRRAADRRRHSHPDDHQPVRLHQRRRDVRPSRRSWKPPPSSAAPARRPSPPLGDGWWTQQVQQAGVRGHRRGAGGRPPLERIDLATPYYVDQLGAVDRSGAIASLRVPHHERAGSVAGWAIDLHQRRPAEAVDLALDRVPSEPRSGWPRGRRGRAWRSCLPAQRVQHVAACRGDRTRPAPARRSASC